MTNHMSDHDAFLRLADAWGELPEELRKQIFKAVYRSDPNFLDKIAKAIGGGFTLKKLVTRPATVVTRIDNLLITINGGKEFCWLVRGYFTNCNKAINDGFMHNFDILVKKSPEMSTKQITENVLAILHSEFKDDQLWNLYENALPVCEPSRFSDDPVDPMELSSDNETTSHISYDKPIPDDALTLKNVPTGRDQHHDLPTEDSVASQNLKPSKTQDRKSTLPASRTKTDSSSTSVNEYLTNANTGEVIKQVCYKLKAMPIAAAEKVLQLCQTTISSLTREYQEYSARQSELDHQLTELRRLGLIHVNVSNEAFSTPFNQLPMSEVTDRLLQGISQATAILDKYKRLVELEDILDIAHKPELCRFDKPEIGKLFDLVDLRLTDLEKLFRDRVISESLLLDFVARLESCDYATARQFVAEITPEVWEDLVRAALLFGHFSGQKVDKKTADKPSTFIATRILQDPLLMSLILSVAWQASSTVGLGTLNLLTENRNPMSIRVLGLALSGLTFEQLRIVAAESPYLAKEISRLTLLSALAHHNLDAIRWLQSFSSNDMSATSAETDFFRECAIANERGCLVQDLSAAFGFVAETLPTDSFQNTATQELKNLSELHGLSGNYRKLRESAREHYILPVMRHVEMNQADSALKLWEGYGDYENMTQHVTKDIETAHKTEQRHLIKTIQYLRTFGDALASWAGSTSQPRNCPNDSFMKAFRDFIKVTGDAEKDFLGALRSVIAGKGSDAAPPTHFGKIAVMAGRVSRTYVDPIYIENWIMACNSPSEETNAGDLLAERLIHVFRQTTIPQTPRGILDHLLNKSEFIAAANLASFYPDMNTVFSEQIEEVRKTTLKGYETSWNEAHSTAIGDANVQLWASEIENLMDEYRFSEARGYLPDLKKAIHEYNNRQSDEYKTEANILRDAGRVVSEGCSLIDLRNEVQLLKKESISNRQHIACLEQVLVSSNYEDAFKEEVKKLLNEIDRPLRWLPPAQSKTISEDLLIILRYLESRVRWRDARPEIYRRLSSSLARFINKTVEVLSNPKANHFQNNKLTDLAMGIELESWEADEVLRYLHDKVQPDEPVEVNTEVLNERSSEHESSTFISYQKAMSVQRGMHQGNDETAKEVLAKLRRTIFGIAEREEKVELPKDKHTALLALCREFKWHEARILSANILLQDPKEDELPKLFDPTYCIALAHDPGKPGLSSEELIAVCLGTILPMLSSQHEQPFYYTDRNSVMESVVRAFLQGLNPRRDLSTSTTDIRIELSSDLSALLEKPVSDIAYRWLMGLLHEASVLVLPGSQQNGATMLATVLWDRLTGVSDSAKSRSKLLLLCFRLNLIDDVIVNLAKAYASPYDYFIIQFLHAVRSSEANETAWDEARRLAQSFVEQVPANKIKPWRVMVDTLNRSRKNESFQERCSITLENCSRQDGGHTFLLELCISPGPYSILETAQLFIGDDTSASFMQIKAVDLIAEGDQIARGQIERITVNLDPSAALDHEVIFPYRLVARTTAGTDIDQRGRWNVNLSQTEQPRLPKHILLNLWKGADGNPVDSTLKAYHGRREESEKLEELLSGRDGRQKSALVIGQRRIGKTSLMVETLRRYPPREGHVCAVYSQFGGIQKRTPTEPLGETVFNALTEVAADVAGYNNEFCKLLSANLGNTWLRVLRRGLNPATSIAAALTTFVDRVTHETKGLIKRMAFFADEFQAIFRYPTEEVDQVMWGLRPLVQLSPTISLIFAGSGLTRELIRNYDKAFFGSIATLDLKPFSIENDYYAIADIFLPEEARQYLCPNLDHLKAIVREAYILTGGHPWYLSMLGRSAATQLQGRILTPILLKEVAQKMVNGGQTDFCDNEIGAARFYGHLFDSLDPVGKQKAYAQLVLANIARQVTLEWPWLTATQAISGPKIEQMRCSSHDCLDALRKLKDEQILDRRIDGGVPKYRIRIPLVAESIRYDADDIEYQAADTLM